MQAPLFVRPLTDSEHDALRAGLHSSAAFTLRRCHTAQRAPVLASARHEHVPAIAHALGCNTQTVRNAIHAFNRSGLDTLTEGSSRPHRIATAFDPVAAERLRALLHQSPRAFDQPTSVWTLDLAAAVSFAQGLTHERVTGETIRVTLKRLGVRWQRAKQWITSPDPAYARKKGGATD
jgi:transposase